MSHAVQKNVQLQKLAFSAAVAAATVATFYWYRRPISPWRKAAQDAPDRRTLHTYLPDAEFAGEVSTIVHASPAAIVEAIRQVTLADMPLANLIGNLRYVPARLFGHAAAAAPDTTPFLTKLVTEGGNIVLGERANEEYVIGAIGKFHNLLDQHFVPLSAPHKFVDFDDPDYQKLAMSFTITSLTGAAEGPYRLTLVHGTHALSPAARVKFALYWLGIKPGGNFVTWLLLRAIKVRAEKSAVISPSVVST